jgi:hypothetical protein
MDEVILQPYPVNSASLQYLSMSKSPKLTFGIIGAFLLVGLALIAFYWVSSNAIDNRSSTRQKEMLENILKWGRLASFPESATDLLVETEGNSFTRSFHASFTAPKEEIEAWITKSPGLIEASRQVMPNNKVKYIIVPGGGAHQAEVIIDIMNDKVEIFVSWS